MTYNFTVKLTRNSGKSELGIDPLLLYGYWERKGGDEGGGLWFDHLPDGKLELVDYDGASELPREWVDLLRANGYVLDSTFDAELSA